MMLYTVLAICFAFISVLSVALYYKKKSQRLNVELNHSHATVAQQKQEIANVQIKQKIESDNHNLGESDVDERLHQNGYYRD